MLDGVVEHYVTSVGEREFDAPFQALLRGMDFTNTHRLHGQFEFGKDFIARRVVDGIETQFVFQTKAGDLDGGDWRVIRGQLDDCYLTDLAHPDFRGDLPRTVVLVLTGRLRGGAALNAQEYAAKVGQRRDGTLEIWDGEFLVEMLAGRPDAVLRGSAELELVEAVSRARMRRLDEGGVRRFALRWTVGPRDRSGTTRRIVQAGVLGQALHANDRADLACLVALLLLSDGYFACADLESTEGCEAQVESATELFRVLGEDFFARIEREDVSPRAIYGAHDDEVFLLGYPILCSKVMEIVSLLALLPSGGEELRQRTSQFLRGFVEANPGCRWPVSDHWASSLLPVVSALGASDADLCKKLLQAIGKWLGDQSEEGLGLAGVFTQPAEVVERVLGPPFEHVAVGPRRVSYLATVLLDLAAIWGWGAEYEAIRRDLRACEVFPVVTEPSAEEGFARFLADGGITEVNPPYTEWRDSGDWRAAPHHRRWADAAIASGEDWWDGIAVSVALRDRHIVPAIVAARQAMSGV